MTKLRFRPYRHADKSACLGLFDANYPDYFAANERPAYDAFLDEVNQDYEVCELDGQIVGAFGLIAEGDQHSLRWILLDPQNQGLGLGTKIMARVIDLGRRSNVSELMIGASHKSAPFFAKIGATVISSKKDGWGPAMDRIDMVLTL